MIPFLDNALKAIHKQYYDDLVDRLNYYYSTLILLFLAILVSAKQYVGNPINCWFPAEFEKSWEQYAESYCFVSGTYYLPFDAPFSDHSKRKIVNYYQWVPIILAIQGLLFYLPNMIWKMLNWQSGINVKSILKMASEAEIADDEKRKKTLQTLAKCIEDSLGLQSALGSVNEFRQLFCFRCGRANAYLTCLYIFTKILYILNIVGQFMLLNSFFNTNYVSWGYQVFWDIMTGNEWIETGHFPRVTMCDFRIREMGQDQVDRTVQCVLMINMFNEKIFLFLWVWLCFVGICVSVNFVYWIFTLVPSYCRYRFVHKYLRIGAEMTNSKNDKSLVEKFVSKALRSDGVLLMRFISGHTGDMLVTELMFRLFQEFMIKMKLRKTEKEKLPLNFILASTASDPLITPTAIVQCAVDRNGINETYDVDNEQHQEQYPMMPSPRAGFVIYRENQAENFEYLLLKSSKSSRWSVPKGHLELSENERTAAIRETKEESGLSYPEDYEIINVFEVTLNYKVFLTGKDKSIKLWLAKLIKNVPVTISHEHKSFGWYSNKFIQHDDSIKMKEHMKNCLNLAEEFLTKRGNL